jgi:fatty-acyl-CoA synthase
MFFCDWLHRREMLSPNKIAPIDAINDGRPITYREWNRPEAATETIVDGWLHTGDLARRDEAGDYYIVGRLKDMIKSGGENIYPAEIEDLMHSHPDIAEAPLIPVPDSKWGEVGRAINVLKPSASLAEADLIDWLRERTAHHKVPKSVVFVDTFPKTAANEVDKEELIEHYGL